MKKLLVLLIIVLSHSITFADTTGQDKEFLSDEDHTFIVTEENKELLFDKLDALSIIGQDKGMLFGGNHAFLVNEISGWVLDNKSGVRQGIYMLFYPAGKTWKNSPVIVYGKSVSKTELPTIRSQVEKTIDDFHNDGSTGYTGEEKEIVKLQNGKEATIYYFSGDKWNNYEAVAYIEEAETINFLVYNARTKESFDKYLEDFNKIFRTYENAYTPPTALDESKANALIAEAKSQLKEPGGQKYENEIMQASGEQMANFMRDCLSYLPEKEMPQFHLFIRINSDGSPSELTVYPTNSLSICFKAMMYEIKYPTHSFDSFLWNMEMSVTP